MASHRGQAFVGRFDQKPKLEKVIGSGEIECSRIAFDIAKRLNMKVAGNTSVCTDLETAEKWGLTDDYPDDTRGLKAMAHNVNLCDATLVVLLNRENVHPTSDCLIDYLKKGCHSPDPLCDHSGKRDWQEILGVRGGFVVYNLNDITQKAFIRFLEVHKIRILNIDGDSFDSPEQEKQFEKWIAEVFIHSMTGAVWVDNKRFLELCQ